VESRLTIFISNLRFFCHILLTNNRIYMLRCIEGHSLYNSGLFWGTITGFQSAFRKTFSRTRRVVEHDTRGLCVNIWHFKVCSTMSRQQKWLLTIYVSDLNVEKTLEVTGQTFVGNLMVELVNRLGRPMLLYMLAGLQVFITCVLYVNCEILLMASKTL
jgi:hypothetical protein